MPLKDERISSADRTCSTGLTQEVSVLLIYAIFFFGGLIFWLIEKRNQMVRFHAMQSMIWSLTVGIVLGICQFLSNIPLLGLVFGLADVIGVLLVIVINIAIIIKSYNGQNIRLPIIAEMSENWMNQL